MKNIKFSLLSFMLILIISTGSAQESNRVRAGLIRTQLTLSPSYMLSTHQSNFYLHGTLEGFITDKISLAGEAYYGLGNLSTEKDPFRFNHSVFWGIAKHFVKNNHDLYIGFQPGVSIAQLNENFMEEKGSKTHIGVNPLASVSLGYNFFFSQIFHFFIQTRLVMGDHSYDEPKNISEIRLSMGLGFNFNAIRDKSGERKSLKEMLTN